MEMNNIIEPDVTNESISEVEVIENLINEGFNKGVDAFFDKMTEDWVLDILLTKRSASDLKEWLFAIKRSLNNGNYGRR